MCSLCTYLQYEASCIAFVPLLGVGDNARAARREDLLQKASAMAQHCSAVHPVVFRGPHPVRDASLYEASGMDLIDVHGTTVANKYQIHML